MLKKVFAAFFSFLSISLLLTVSLPVASCADDEKELRLICETGYTQVENMLWKVYHIGERKNNEFTLTGQFENYPVDMNNISEDNIRETAQALESFAMGDSLKETASGYTDKEGTVSFTGLVPGLYLAVPESVESDSQVYYSSPLIVELTDGPEKVFPKVYATSSTDVEKQFKVKKVWLNDEGNADKRPADITVDIFKDGSRFDTVKLDASNDWEYSWNTADANAEWRVVERDVPQNYTVQVEHNLMQFLIKNSYADKKPPVTTTAPPKKTGLPQTGQPWVPVFVLAAGGIFLVCIGIDLKLRTDKNEK